MYSMKSTINLDPILSRSAARRLPGGPGRAPRPLGRGARFPGPPRPTGLTLDLTDASKRAVINGLE